MSQLAHSSPSSERWWGAPFQYRWLTLLDITVLHDTSVSYRRHTQGIDHNDLNIDISMQYVVETSVNIEQGNRDQ